MQARLDLAVSKGCVGVEPDNVDGYQNSSGFPLTAADQLAYNRFLAGEARARGGAAGGILGGLPGGLAEFLGLLGPCLCLFLEFAAGTRVVGCLFSRGFRAAAQPKR